MPDSQAEHDLHELHRLPNTVGAEDFLPDVILHIIRVEDFLPFVMLLIIRVEKPRRGGLFGLTVVFATTHLKRGAILQIISLEEMVSVLT